MLWPAVWHFNRDSYEQRGNLLKTGRNTCKSLRNVTYKTGKECYLSRRKWRTNSRCSHRSYSVRKGVLRNFAKFTGKHLCQGLFFNKVAGLRSATLLEKRLWHRCFPVNFEKFLRTHILQNTSGRLLLQFRFTDSMPLHS